MYGKLAHTRSKGPLQADNKSISTKETRSINPRRRIFSCATRSAGRDWSVAQIMPGPNVINLALIVGSRYFGLKGALVGLAGMMAVPLVLVLTLALIYSQFAEHPSVAGALRGMGAVASGLILATGIKLISALKTNVLGWRWCTALGLACLVGIVVVRLPLAYVLFGLGGLAFTLTFRRLKP
jgi:chromate transporter